MYEDINFFLAKEEKSNNKLTLTETANIPRQQKDTVSVSQWEKTESASPSWTKWQIPLD